MIDSLPYYEILEQSKFKAIIADDKPIKVTEKLRFKFVMGIIENSLGPGENAGYHFLLFPKYFQMPSSVGSFQVATLW